MKKRFKRIYLEITNNCNLSCPFCNKSKRSIADMEKDDFIKAIERLRPLTDYLYFHVMGEPLIHPLINEYIDIASEYFKINITTNGYLIKRINNNKNIRQINISLHSYNINNGKSLSNYMTDVIDTTNRLLKNGTYINYRLWKVSNNKEIKEYLENYYHVTINGNTKINDHIFVSIEKEFIWPNLDNDYYKEEGTCRGTIDHVGVLVDGTIVPCCLDTNACVDLGNIFNGIDMEHIEDIANNFTNNKKIEELCKHCNFYEQKQV